MEGKVCPAKKADSMPLLLCFHEITAQSAGGNAFDYRSQVLGRPSDIQ